MKGRHAYSTKKSLRRDFAGAKFTRHANKCDDCLVVGCVPNKLCKKGTRFYKAWLRAWKKGKNK